MPKKAKTKKTAEPKKASKKKAKKKAAKAKKEELPMLIKQSTVKDTVKGLGMNCGGDFLEGLSVELYKTIRKCAKRAKLNNRSTVKGRDL